MLNTPIVCNEISSYTERIAAAVRSQEKNNTLGKLVFSIALVFVVWMHMIKTVCMKSCHQAVQVQRFAISYVFLEAPSKKN